MPRFDPATTALYLWVTSTSTGSRRWTELMFRSSREMFRHLWSLSFFSQRSENKTEHRGGFIGSGVGSHGRQQGVIERLVSVKCDATMEERERPGQNQVLGTMVSSAIVLVRKSAVLE